MNGPCAVRLPLDCMTKHGSVSQAGRETGDPLFCPAWQLPSGRNPFCKGFPLYCRQETVAGILKKSRTGWEPRIKNTFQNRVYLFIFCVKTHNWNCYIAQLFSDQSSIVQLGVVVWSEFPDGQQKMAVSSHLSSLVHKRIGNTKSPRSLLNTGSAGFCSNGGQIVVTVVDSTEKTEVLMYKGN